MAYPKISVLEAVNIILANDPTNEKTILAKLSPLEKNRILELYSAGIKSDITIYQMANRGFFKKTYDQQKLFPATVFSLLKIFDSLNDGVLLLDYEGFVRYINPSFERIAQTKKSTLVGRPLLETRPGARLVDVVKTKTPLIGVKRIFKDHQYITDMYPIMVNNQCVGGVTIARDITEVKNLQLKLHDYHSKYNDAIQKNRPKDKAIYTFSDIIGSSIKLKKVKELAQKLAYSNLNILIRGASGTGKELFAHSIHNESRFAEKPFITVNCPAVPANLLESELFGYTKGAFTGADPNGKKGLIELANEGTLFLDEIGDMDIQLQAKLLRVLQTGEFQRLGSTQKVQSNFRLIAATNQNLENLIEKKLFREDLFYRLNVSTIHLPSLQETPTDILELAEYFLNRTPSPLGKLTLSEKTKKILFNYPWPGNIRELENTIRFITTITENPLITEDLLPAIFLKNQSNPLKKDSVNLKQIRFDSEKARILQALEKHGSSVQGKKQAAKALGISLTTLYERLKIYRLS